MSDRPDESTSAITSVVRGHLELLERAVDEHGTAGSSATRRFLKAFAGYLEAEERGCHDGRGRCDEDFHAVLARICALLRPQAVRRFRGLSPAARDLLTHAYQSQPWRPAVIARDKRDRPQGLVRLRYRYTGPVPVERIVVDGRAIRPTHAKVRALRYFDRDLIHERVLWVPAGPVAVTLDAAPTPVHGVKRRPVPMAEPQLTGWRGRLARLADTPGGIAVTRRLGAWLPVRRLFGDAWVLIDRVHEADDSAEILFRHLRTHNRGVNAWFVIEGRTADHRRLRKAGYRRVVPYGSLRWRLLMLNARHVISSHADGVIYQPPAAKRLIPRPRWRFTFLQHGVIQRDLSNWLNNADIDLFVTSTPAEYESVCGPGTGYLYTTREARLTGLPRFDALRRVGARVPAEQRDLVVFVPTWRTWLVQPSVPGTRRHAGMVGDIAGSEFVRMWRALIGDPALREVAAGNGLTLATLVHPIWQQVGLDMDLPEHIARFPCAGGKARELFARARVLVTDYSSMAFDAAYIDRPVVYFQFDRDRFLGGDHPGRSNYWDYIRDGFGPVTTDPTAARAAIADTLSAGTRPAPEYARRIAAAFPVRDGECCQRVVRAIQDSTERAAVIPAPAVCGEPPIPVTRWQVGAGHPLPPVDTTRLRPTGFRADWDDDEGTLSAGRDGFSVRDDVGTPVLSAGYAEDLTEDHVASLRRFGRLRVHVGAEVAQPGARLLSQLACAGIPVFTPGLPPAAAHALGSALADRFTVEPETLSNVVGREDWSVGTRRLALGQFGPWTRQELPTVSVLLATYRPAFVPFALAQVARQDWPRVQAVLLLHGMSADEPVVADAIAAHPDTLEVVEVPRERVLGEVLNQGLARCLGRLVTKMDDDDWYGPHHLTDLVHARMYSGAALTGLGGFWMYLQNSDMTLWRTGLAEALVTWVHGGTTLLATDDVRALGGWRPVSVGEDRQLQLAVLAAGGEMYSTHGLGFLYYRGHEHTYVVAAGDQEWLARSDYPRVAGFQPPPQLAPLAHPRVGLSAPDAAASPVAGDSAPA